MPDFAHIEDAWFFYETELRALNRFLEKEWIPLDNEELRKVVSKISNIVKELDADAKLGRPNSQTT